MFKIAETIKKQVDDFKTTVPLAVALRKEGMKDRHWDAISSAVGFDIRPNDNFTLTTVIEKGMLNHIEIGWRPMNAILEQKFRIIRVFN